MTTMTDTLRERAITAVRATDPADDNRRFRAVKYLYDYTGRRHFLRDLIGAVDWALAHDTGRAQYTFPNGHSASVIPDPRTPLRFEVFSTDPADTPRGHVISGLTTGDVEAKLATIRDLDQIIASEEGWDSCHEPSPLTCTA